MAWWQRKMRTVRKWRVITDKIPGRGTKEAVAVGRESVRKMVTYIPGS